MPKIKTILVTGSNGQLGQSIKSISSQNPEYQFTFIDQDEMDLSQPESISHYFQQNQFDLIINCAAYTAVDRAEEESEIADAINHLAVKQLAEITQQHNLMLIHIGTDYVYDGTAHKPYQEKNQTNPQNIYGISKLKGEQAIQTISPNAIIIRTSWVYSEFGNNFVKTMLRLGQEREQLNVIFDQVGSPTYAKDLAHCILQIVALSENDQGVFLHDENQDDTNNVPVYHFSNEGVCSWYDFAKAIFELTNTPCAVNPIETKDYPTPAKRPHYSVLNKSKIKQAYNLNIPYWKDSLYTCIKKLQENNAL